MEKLLNKYMANPSAENRAKLLAYDVKHAFAACFLTARQCTILNQIKAEHEAREAA
jgi:hypothetical protein